MIDRYGLLRSLKSKPKKEIWAYLSNVLELEIIKNDVRSYLKSRINWKVD